MGLIHTGAAATGNMGCVILADGTELIARLAEAWKWIRETEVLVGIPQAASSDSVESGAPSGAGGNQQKANRRLTNVELMYIHTNGSPVNHIPARPTIEPAINENETHSRIIEYMNEAFNAAIRFGDLKTAYNCYSKAGMIGATAAQKKFGYGLAPNADITINGGWMRNHVTGQPVYVKGKHSSAPLIDTGNLRKSITYVIRRNGKDI